MNNNDVIPIPPPPSASTLGIIGAFLISQSVDIKNVPKIDRNKITPKRRKSKKDNKIEKLEEERDYWKNKCLREENNGDTIGWFDHWFE